MTKKRSLLRELMIDLAVSQVVCLVFVIILVVFQLYATVEGLESRDMREVAKDIASHLHLNGQAELLLPPSSSARFSPHYGRYSYVVVDGQGKFLFGSDGVTEPLSAPPQSDTRFESRHGKALLWGITKKFVVDEQTVLIQVAEDMNHQDVLMDEIVEGFISHAVWLLVPLFAALAGVMLLRMHRRLQPLRHASSQAAHISAQTSHVRLAVEDVPVEILPLVDAVNRGLTRLECALLSQKEFLANAAHELRTPLTILRTRLSTLPENDLRLKLEEDAAILSRLVTQLLRAAELEGLEIETGEDVDLVHLSRAIATYLEPAAATHGKGITVSALGSVVIRGNMEALGQALTNLIENALAHTPIGTNVEINVGDSLHPFMSVRDHGPGIPPEERDKVFQRFWRRDRHKGHGSGLGLSIVSRAVQAHQGQVTVHNAPDGGAVFTISFPGGHSSMPPLRIP